MRALKKKAFLEAYDAYADALYRHCFFRVFSKTLAEDLVQETYIRAWQYLEKGEDVENMRAFLYRIATNLIIDNFRKKKEESLDALMEDSASSEPSYNGEEGVRKQVLVRELFDATRHLTQEERELITMRYVDDLSPSEIAEIMGITPNNASVKLNRAIASLKKYVGDI